MEKKIRIFHLGNNDSDAELKKSTIEEGSLSCELKRVCKMEEYIHALMTEIFDVILIDSILFYLNEINVFEFAKEITPNIAFTIVSF